MKIDIKENYTLLTSDENSIEEFTSNFTEAHNLYAEKHLIIQLSDNLNITKKNIFVFLKYAEQHAQNGTTFVVVCSDINIDEFPDSFNIVPTLEEAEDVLEMENIERDLGF